MWTCHKCSARSETAMEVCPSCGAVDVQPTAPDVLPTPAATMYDVEAETEYELQSLPDPELSIVECYIGVTKTDASAIATRLRDLGIPVFLYEEDSVEDGKVHRVRVPMVDLGRALAVIDLLQKRKTARP